MPIKTKTPPSAHSSSRRTFLKNAGVAAAAFTIVPRFVLGGNGFVAPTDTLYIAGIGAGGKGTSDLEEMSKSPNVKIVALCDVDDREAAKSRKNFPAATYHKDFRQMLDKESHIDACTVSTPDHTHAVAAMAAMVRGNPGALHLVSTEPRELRGPPLRSSERLWSKRRPAQALRPAGWHCARP